MHLFSEVIERYFECNQPIQACIQWKRVLNHQTIISSCKQWNNQDTVNLQNKQQFQQTMYKFLIWSELKSIATRQKSNN